MAEPTTWELDKRLSVHEDGCTLRQRAINARLARIERILIWGASTMITGQFGIIAFLFVRFVVR